MKGSGPLPRPAGRAVTVVLFILAWLAVGGAPRPSAQSASAPDITAVYLLNFAKFTEWPADALAPDAPLLVCAIDPAVATALSTLVEGKTVGTHRVTSARVAADPPPRQCAVLYAGALDERRTTALVASLKGASVLLVGESDRFIKGGGMIHLFVENDRMRFAINVGAAERAKLHLSSKLLTMARIVKE